MKPLDGSSGGALTSAAAALSAECQEAQRGADNRSEIRPPSGGGEEMEEGNKATQSACVTLDDHQQLQRLSVL